MLSFWIVIVIMVLAFVSTILFFFKACFRGRVGSMISFIFSLFYLVVSLVARGKEHPTAFYFGLGAWLFFFVLGLITSYSKKE